MSLYRLLVLFLMGMMCLQFIGCGPNQKAIPAALKDPVEHVMEGRVRRIWGGDNFEFGEAMELHFVLIRGVDTPKPGQRFYDEAKQFLTKSVRGQTTRVEVVGHDELMREFADVYVLPKKKSDSRTNVGLELIKAGLGWYDGMEFDQAEEFKKAEAVARSRKIGLWVDEDPTPPWKFEEN